MQTVRAQRLRSAAEAVRAQRLRLSLTPSPPSPEGGLTHHSHFPQEANQADKGRRVRSTPVGLFGLVTLPVHWAWLWARLGLAHRQESRLLPSQYNGFLVREPYAREAPRERSVELSEEKSVEMSETDLLVFPSRERSSSAAALPQVRLQWTRPPREETRA